MGSNVASNRRVLLAKHRGDHGSGNVCIANLQVRIVKYELCGFEVLEIYTVQTASTSSVLPYGNPPSPQGKAYEESDAPTAT